MRQAVYDYIQKKYKVKPEYLWRRYPDYAVFRHTDNSKWFALAASVRKDIFGEAQSSGEASFGTLKTGEERFGTQSSGALQSDFVDVINLKVDDLFFRDLLIREAGITPAYHMNKQHWISVRLDGSVPQEKVFDLIDMSFLATASVKKKQQLRPPKEWIVPANPAYFDIVRAFEEAKEINWKQGAGIKKGDTVFMYVGAPVSAILYKCKVTETNIPYRKQNEHITIRELMRIRLQKRYAPDRFPFSVLKEEYDVRAVRGPRGIPNSLSEALKH